MKMEIPAGKGCGACPFCAVDSEYDPTCLAFEDPTVDKATYDAHFILHYTTGADIDRCPACLAAYPNGAVITITAKEGK